MLVSIVIALPFAIKWPKQAGWLRDTQLGQVGRSHTSETRVALSFLPQPCPAMQNVRAC